MEDGRSDEVRNVAGQGYRNKSEPPPKPEIEAGASVAVGAPRRHISSTVMLVSLFFFFPMQHFVHLIRNVVLLAVVTEQSEE
jgi:hypothetical protein